MKDTPRVIYKTNNRNNGTYNNVTKAICNKCLEHATFRVMAVEKVNKATGNLEYPNRVACTRCLGSVPYNKKYKIIQHPIIFVLKFTWKHKLVRNWLRTKRYFKGDHIYKSFGRKRK